MTQTLPALPLRLAPRISGRVPPPLSAASARAHAADARADLDGVRAERQRGGSTQCEKLHEVVRAGGVLRETCSGARWCAYSSAASRSVAPRHQSGVPTVSSGVPTDSAMCNVGSSTVVISIDRIDTLLHICATFRGGKYKQKVTVDLPHALPLPSVPGPPHTRAHP